MTKEEIEIQRNLLNDLYNKRENNEDISCDYILKASQILDQLLMANEIKNKK